MDTGNYERGLLPSHDTRPGSTKCNVARSIRISYPTDNLSVGRPAFRPLTLRLS
jgi:hypothetical protein